MLKPADEAIPCFVVLAFAHNLCVFAVAKQSERVALTSRKLNKVRS